MVAPISLRLLLVTALVAVPLAAQSGDRTAAQIKASYDAHQGDFDYLLGDWEFTSVSKQYGAAHGFWSAARLPEGAQIWDEYRVVGDSGETWYVANTLRAYNAVLDEWELVSTEGATGLQNVGTAHRVGAEMHIEQRFGVMSDTPSLWRIRYFDIGPDRFSWAGDRSIDDGKTWVTDYLRIEARRCSGRSGRHRGIRGADPASRRSRSRSRRAAAMHRP